MKDFTMRTSLIVGDEGINKLVGFRCFVLRGCV